MEKNKRIIMLWISQVNKLVKQHSLKSKEFSKKNSILFILSLFFNSACAIFTSLNFFDENKSTSKFFTIISLISAVISSSLIVISEKFEYAQESERHRNAANEYSSIAGMMQVQLFKVKIVHLDVFLETFVGKIDTIRNYSPNPGTGHGVSDLPTLLLKHNAKKSKKHSNSETEILESEDLGLFLQDEGLDDIIIETSNLPVRKRSIFQKKVDSHDQMRKQSKSDNSLPKFLGNK